MWSALPTGRFGAQPLNHGLVFFLFFHGNPCRFIWKHICLSPSPTYQAFSPLAVCRPFHRPEESSVVSNPGVCTVSCLYRPRVIKCLVRRSQAPSRWLSGPCAQPCSSLGSRLLGETGDQRLLPPLPSPLSSLFLRLWKVFPIMFRKNALFRVRDPLSVIGPK